jgi:hypothetical protein
MPVRQLWSWGTPSSNQWTCRVKAWLAQTSRRCRSAVALVVQRSGGISLIVGACGTQSRLKHFEGAKFPVDVAR